MLNTDALDLVQSDRVAGAVTQLGRARRLMVRDLLFVLNRTTILRRAGNRSGSEGMAAGRVRRSGLYHGKLATSRHKRVQPSPRALGSN
jgi:hypothetical protein